jgi:hypothetical protein
MSNLNNLNRVYSPSRFYNEEQTDKSTRPNSRARSGKSRSDRDSIYTRSHTPESMVDESLEEYYPKSRKFNF